ncbi:MAG: hypothetical protein LUC90_07090 [Lachnospiraceae bacterium]|nr:hypothetical protein [Lachnospiraceae bacterium]
MSTTILQNALSSLTGNVPKAILFVREMNAHIYMDAPTREADDLRQNLDFMQRTANALNQGSLTYSTIKKSGAMTGTGYAALEVQYNPNTIYLSTQGAGNRIQYSGGNLGGEGVNQTVQNFENAISTLSCQLLFDAVNVSDAFMLENMNLSLANTAAAAASSLMKIGDVDYSVQPVMDGIMALLTQETTRHVIFFWGRMFFRGELTSVDSNYTMFNKTGNPVRGTIDITITQPRESAMDKLYWEEAFTSVFGSSDVSKRTGSGSLLSQLTNNSILNLNL